MKPSTSIEKVCRVLRAFRSRPTMGITELSERARLLPSDVHRILKSLELFGYVGQDPQTRKYSLGLELLKLGYLVHRRIRITEVARPFLHRLAEEAEATASLAVFDPRELEVVFVEQVDSPGEIQIHYRVGRPVAHHATAVGKVLTAFLGPAGAARVSARHGLPKLTERTITDARSLRAEFEAVRAQGCAVDREEALDGACCVAAPVRNHLGNVVAAISISMLAAKLNPSGERRWIAAVKAAAAKVSAALGYQGPGAA